MLDIEDARARASLGSALLDGTFPGWFARIAVDKLAMETCDRCILGQLFGDYTKGFKALVRRYQGEWKLFSAAAHGFTLPMTEQEYLGAITSEDPGARRAFAPLAQAWREEIRKRVASTMPGPGRE